MAITRGEHVFVNDKWRFEYIDTADGITRFVITYNYGLNRKNTSIIAVAADVVTYTGHSEASISEPLVRNALGAKFTKLYTIKTAEDLLLQDSAVDAFEEEEVHLAGIGFIDLGILSPNQLILLNNLEVRGVTVPRKEIVLAAKQLDVPFENLSAHLAIACAEHAMHGGQRISCDVDVKAAKSIGSNTFRQAASVADLINQGHGRLLAKQSASVTAVATAVTEAE